MVKKLRKMFSLFLVIAMIFSLGTTALAADKPTRVHLTVTIGDESNVSMIELSVTVDGVSYTASSAPNPKMTGGHWNLDFSEHLADTTKAVVGAVTVTWNDGTTVTAYPNRECAIGEGTLNVSLDPILKQTYSVIYDVNGGTGGTGPATEAGLSNGSHTLLATPAPTKASDASYTYSFGGWAATATGTDVITQVTIAGADVTVYAIWTATPIQPPTYYSVIYDVNGGTAGTGPLTEAGLSNGSHTLLATPAPIKASDASYTYSFGGWAATATGTDVITQVTIAGADVTVYAIWNATPIQPPTDYSVIYDVNGGTGGTGPATEAGLSNGSHTLLATPAPTKASDASYTYSFGGWAATATGTDVITQVTIAGADVTVYAIWTATPIQPPTYYSVIYDVNGGTAGTGPLTEAGLSNGSHTLLATPAPIKASDASYTYSFGGWAATATGTDVITQVTIAGADVTVYAIWTATPIQPPTYYSVIYDVNGGTAGTGPATEAGLSNGSHTLLATPVPTKASDASYTYSFGGWAATATGTDVITQVTIAGADVTVYAIWNATPIQPPTDYSVIYDVNGGTAGTGPLTEAGLSNGSHTLLATPVPTKASDASYTYSFGGWAATATGTDVITQVTIAGADVTVYAIWTATPIQPPTYYSVIYDVNGGTAGTGPATEAGLSNGSHTLLATPAPTKASDASYTYSFGGWAATATGTDVITQVTIAGADVTVYAIWNATSIPTEPPYEPPVQYASLTVDKAVSGTNASTTEEFAITVQFTLGNTGALTDIANDAGLTVAANGTYLLSLSAGDSVVTFSNIPMGVTYTVSENLTQAQIDAGWTAPTDDESGQTNSTARVNVLVKNVYSEPQVLGATEEPTEEPEVLGAIDTLPQTGGISSAVLLGLFGTLLIFSGAALSRRKKE